MTGLSVIIPAREEPYLQQTIDGVLEAAVGDIEILVMLDGWWPMVPIKPDKRVITTHSGNRIGMRSAINAGARLAKGEFLMKLDAHCMMAVGFDEVLKAHCRDMGYCVLVPVRYDLDVKYWIPNKEKKYEFQYLRRQDLKGKNWPECAERCEMLSLPTLMTTQGSCWFMRKSWFEHLGGLDDKNFGTMGREAQEVTINTWLAGGLVMLDRNTWYAHWSKPADYVISARAEKSKSRTYAKQIWTEEKLRPLIERFAPVPSWEETVPKVVEEPMKEAQWTVELKPPEKSVMTFKRHIGFGRAELYEMFAQRGYKVGAEIGVWDGNNAKRMFEKIPGVKLYLVDPYVDYELARRNRGLNRLAKARERALRNTKGYDREIVLLHSERAAEYVPDASLDFVHIDGNHKYEFAMLDIILWERKVRKGGVVSGHDYYNDRKHQVGVKQAVDDYVRYHGIKLNVTDKMADPHGRSAVASWWWEK